MIFNKIHVFVRQTNHHKPNNNRPNWFSYEKVFQNLLKTSNPNLIDITVVFDGDIKNHFTEKYSGFEIIPINAPPPGNFTSIIKLCEIIKEKNLSENTIIYILENDYIHIPYWTEITLDFFNTVDNSENCMLSLFDHRDKYLFIDKNRTDHFSMYKDLTSTIYISNYRHWRTIPLICISCLFTNNIFRKSYDLFIQGIADNTLCGEMSKRNTWFASPIPAIATHCERPFIAPIVDWEKIININ